MKVKLLLIALLLGTVTAHAATPVVQLRAAAEQAAPFTPAAASLDPRVQVARCEGPLQSELSSVRGRQATVLVRCTQPQWTLYVPVRAVGRDQVVVLQRSIAGDTVIRAEDVALESRTALAAGYGSFDDPQSVIGLHSRRALPAGRVLGPADVTRPAVVRRGDRVGIEVQTAAVTIRMNGEALADGGVGQRIPVRNVSSGKRLEAIVRSAGTVEVPR